MLFIHLRHLGMHIEIKSYPNFVLWAEIFLFLHVSIWGFLICVSRKDIFLDPSISVLQYSNWYINGNVFTSTTAWKTRRSFYHRTPKVNIGLCWYHSSFDNISLTIVIDTLLERLSMSRVPQDGSPKIIWFSFQKKALTRSLLRDPHVGHAGYAPSAGDPQFQFW